MQKKGAQLPSTKAACLPFGLAIVRMSAKWKNIRVRKKVDVKPIFERNLGNMQAMPMTNVGSSKMAPVAAM